MKHEIVASDQLLLAVMIYYGDPFGTTEGWSEQNEIGKLWSRFNAVWDRGGEWTSRVVEPSVAYEIHIEPDDYEATKCFYVMVGVEVRDLSPLPLVLCHKLLPATTYATFTLKGSEITSDWPHQIYQEWLPSSAYEEAHPLTIERYGPRFKGPEDPDSELDILVPVKPREVTPG